MAKWGSLRSGGGRRKVGTAPRRKPSGRNSTAKKAFRSMKPQSKVKVVGYSLRDAAGQRVYTGTTKNPLTRRAEHKSAGKSFKYMQVETEPMSRKSAEQWEARSLKGYRSRVGKNPKYNKTNDGRYHRPR